MRFNSKNSRKNKPVKSKEKNEKLSRLFFCFAVKPLLWEMRVYFYCLLLYKLTWSWIWINKYKKYENDENDENDVDCTLYNIKERKEKYNK